MIGRIYSYLEEKVREDSKEGRHKAVITKASILLFLGTWPYYYNMRGSAYYHLKEYKKAIRDCTKAIYINPSEWSFYSSRAGAYFATEQYDLALADYDKAVSLIPNKLISNRISLFVACAYAYIKMNDYEKTIPEYTKAIELSPDNADLYDWRGYAYAKVRL